MGKREVKQELKKLNQDQLVSLILELYDKHKVVKAHLEFFAVVDEAKLMEPYRKRVAHAFGGRNGLFGTRIEAPLPQDPNRHHFRP